jgi:hypothetical protein
MIGEAIIGGATLVTLGILWCAQRIVRAVEGEQEQEEDPEAARRKGSRSWAREGRDGRHPVDLRDASRVPVLR